MGAANCPPAPHARRLGHARSRPTRPMNDRLRPRPQRIRLYLVSGEKTFPYRKGGMARPPSPHAENFFSPETRYKQIQIGRARR